MKATIEKPVVTVTLTMTDREAKQLQHLLNGSDTALANLMDGEYKPMIEGSDARGWICRMWKTLDSVLES